MFTKDQIKQLQELFKAGRQSTRKIVREEIGKTEYNLNKQFTGLDNKVTSLDHKATGLERKVTGLDGKVTGLDQGLINLNKRIDESDARMEAGFLSLRKQQDQDRRDWTDFFHEAGLFFDEMRNKLMRRIERIENHLDLPPIKG